MSDFNYVDALNNSKAYDYYVSQNDKAIQLQGRATYIFPLAKDSTVKSPVYNEAVDGRIYLPCFQQRALYNNVDFQGLINTNIFVENEENITFEYNLSRLVTNIRDLKQQPSGELFITNKSQEIFHCIIENNRFILESLNGIILTSQDLTKYSNINLFINAVKKECSLIDFEYKGNAESAKNISSINVKLYPNKKQKVIVENNLYKECSDIIEAGYVIVVDNCSRAYQVTNVYPANNFVNKYISIVCQAKLTDMALLNLPDNFRAIIARNRYSMPKTKFE